MQKPTWIIEVLGDMINFAEMNGLPKISSQLQEARRVAIAEINLQTSDAGSFGTIDHILESQK